MINQLNQLLTLLTPHMMPGDLPTDCLQHIIKSWKRLRDQEQEKYDRRERWNYRWRASCRAARALFKLAVIALAVALMIGLNICVWKVLH